MKVLNNPPKETWPELVRRPQLSLEFLESSVRNTINRVRMSGDAALKELTLQFDGVRLDALQVSEKEIEHAIASLDGFIKKAIQVAAENIRKFHSLQKREPFATETMPGVKCWQKYVPIQKVGIYTPGGTAPLFSTVLMLGIPAQLAGCRLSALGSFNSRLLPPPSDQLPQRPPSP